MSARAAAGVRGRAVAAALVLGPGLLLGDAPPAGAHATLVGTVPAADAMLDAAPDVVELQFDEPVEVTDGAVQVFGPGGERVDRGTVDTDDGMTLRAPLGGRELLGCQIEEGGQPYNARTSCAEIVE